VTPPLRKPLDGDGNRPTRNAPGKAVSSSPCWSGRRKRRTGRIPA